MIWLIYFISLSLLQLSLACPSDLSQCLFHADDMVQEGFTRFFLLPQLLFQCSISFLGASELFHHGLNPRWVVILICDLFQSLPLSMQSLMHVLQLGQQLLVAHLCLLQLGLQVINFVIATRQISLLLVGHQFSLQLVNSQL